MEITFVAEDGEDLVGQIDYREPEYQGIVFVIPGAFATDRYGSPLGFPALKNFYVPLKEKIISQTNFAFFNYDRRKTGKSTHENLSTPVENDVFCIYRQIVNLFPNQQIVLLGQSYGAGTIKKYFRYFYEIQPPKGILLLSSLGKLTDDILESQIPVHVIVGENDDYGGMIIKENFHGYNDSLISYDYLEATDHLLCKYQKTGMRSMSILALESIAKWLKNLP
ncbi:hypothetical protein [Candidatus Uabimicrobium sp. HlEnr_7]|uniref:hypothetical protein n=1 Tax=Candidatus Uabimicrobium helgolandensis TaxID=3095367 RepID=UPI0035580A9A